ncbi:SAM-dependent methyltransferase [Streptomyces orinoci]|uniref:Class I SAM-dependent methyltransferase n=1 Tax=Streptomyces orinoci TaxID=67339 RepID=A0ABV3JWB1_STRON|nr:class I SAM-dependent methyltransferase [Streptomyces orinoci]
MTDAMPPTQRFWEDFYRDPDRPHSPVGKLNALLVAEAGSLTPGTALDLGCAEGSDAIWLARQGWRVTAVDVSGTALGRAAERAADAGVAELIDWQRHDLSESFPSGEFDLVSAQFLHSPDDHDGRRESILRRAAQAVAPGGVLLISGHAGWPSWNHEPPEGIELPSNAEVLDSLRLEPGGWRVERDEVLVRESTGPEGQLGTREDGILRIRRLR